MFKHRNSKITYIWLFFNFLILFNMANQFAAYIYGTGANAANSTSAVGMSMSFPSQGVFLQAITPGKEMGGGVVCNTAITLLPGTAPSPILQVFYSPALIGSLVTAANE